MDGRNTFARNTHTHKLSTNVNVLLILFHYMKNAFFSPPPHRPPPSPFNPKWTNSCEAYFGKKNLRLINDMKRLFNPLTQRPNDKAAFPYFKFIVLKNTIVKRRCGFSTCLSNNKLILKIPIPNRIFPMFLIKDISHVLRPKKKKKKKTLKM